VLVGAAAKRYARAIFELAREEKQLDEWSQRLATIRAILENPQVRSIVANPSVPSEERLSVLDRLDLPGVGPEGLNLMRLLVGNGRIEVIDQIAIEYESMADRQAGRVRATATTAIELSAADRGRFAKELSDKLGEEVLLELRVDPEILGGLVLQVGDRLYDASVAGRLQQLRRQVVLR
jgi:F-type H+-transporting ATPase subunit delta